MAVALPAICTRPEFPLLVAVNVPVVALVAVLGPPGVATVALLACGVPLAIGLAQRPQRGLLVLAALAPFNGLLIIVPHPPALDGWKEGLVLATLLCTFLAPATARADSKERLPGWSPAVIGLVGLAVVSGLAIGGAQALVGLKVGYFFVLVAVAVWRCPLDGRERDRLVTILMVVGALTAAYGLVQQVLGAGRLNAMGYPYNDTIRFTGGFLRSFSTFNQPFGFGFFLMVVLLVGIPQALSEPRRWRNRVFLLLLPLLGLGLLSSVVRGAWLGAAVGIAYLGAHRYRVLLLLIPLAAVSVAFLPGEFASSALSPSSAEQRTSSWQENIGRVLAHPLGVGVGASGAAAEKVAGPDGAKTYQPDNFYFKILLELGLLGLWLLVLLLVAAFACTRAAAKRLAGRDAALASGVSAMVVAAAAASVVATYFEIFPMDLLFWLLIAVVARCDPESA
ncbi:MAG TPA: O-antigen ligase family protein [Acidimicrobiales bacterium]|nr:O-antigen ligase family protein [Acidimicrobiales bacterium]